MTSTIYGFDFQDLSFTNVRYSTGYSMIRLPILQGFTVNSLSVTNISSTSSVDTESYLLVATEIDLASSRNSEITNLDYTNSSISLFLIENFINTSEETKTFTFSNFEIYN